MEEILKKRRTLQETMNFMAALSAGIEFILGRGARPTQAIEEHYI